MARPEGTRLAPRGAYPLLLELPDGYSVWCTLSAPKRRVEGGIETQDAISLLGVPIHSQCGSECQPEHSSSGLSCILRVSFWFAQSCAPWRGRRRVSFKSCHCALPVPIVCSVLALEPNPSPDRSYIGRQTFCLFPDNGRTLEPVARLTRYLDHHTPYIGWPQRHLCPHNRRRSRAHSLYSSVPFPSPS